MNSWKHPQLGFIDPLADDRALRKVWKHFYDPAEHWERICAENAKSMRIETEKHIGISRAGTSELPNLKGKKRRILQELLMGHHEIGYGPTYQLEMARPSTWWTPEMDANFRHFALTPKSIFIVIELHRPQSWVVTAYRPHPPRKRVNCSEDDLRQHGEWYFEKETGMDKSMFARIISDKLVKTNDTPTTADELWWLVSAIGYARLVDNHTKLGDALADAEARLSQVPKSVFESLNETLDWEGCLNQVVEGLKNSRPEELEHALSNAEELLAIAEVTKSQNQAEGFLAQFNEVIAWLPPEWNHLIETATTRSEILGSSTAMACRLWEQVKESAIGATIRESEPAVRPEPTIVDSLFASEPDWLSRQVITIKEYFETLSQEILDGLRVQAPEPALGEQEDSIDIFELRGTFAVSASEELRIFIMAKAYQQGYEITEAVQSGDDHLWDLEKEDDVILVILVTGDRPIDGDTLEAVLEHSKGRNDVRVAYRKISRSM